MVSKKKKEEENTTGFTKGVTIPGFDPNKTQAIPSATPPTTQNNPDKSSPYKSKDEAVAAGEARRSANAGQVQIIRDSDTGKKTGIKLPDGRILNGISPKEVDFLERKYLGLTTSASGRPFADETTASQKQADMQQQNLMMNPLIPQQQIEAAGSGQPNFNNTPVGARDELTSDIIEKNRMHDVITPAWGISGPDLLNIAPGIGQRIAKIVSGSNPKVKDFLTDYSNQDNFDSVKRNIQSADIAIAAAIIAASDPEYSKDAIFTYEEAMNKKRRSMEQLKLISQGDQKAYINNVKDELIKLQTYFDSQMKTNDDVAFRTALEKANMLNAGVQ